MTLIALLLDLGETLVHGEHVIDHVPDALAALNTMHTRDGRKLELALVSDYTMPAERARDNVDRLFEEYVDRVRLLGLLPFFDPPSRHITLSTQAGVRKPDPALFRLALERIGLEPDLRAAMFVTEDASHVEAARALGMTCWRFGGDFVDWADLPHLVAAAIAASEKTEEELYAQALEETGAVSHDATLAPGQTHARVEGSDGSKIVRKRFSMD